MDPLSPREIQARVRAGASPEDLAAETGWDLERIERYAQPLIVERAFVADAAREVLVRTPRGAMELERAVADVLFEAGVPVHTVVWDSWRRPDGRWIVTLSFPVGEREVKASWGFDLRGKVLTDIDEAARWAVGASDISLDDLVRMQTVVLPTRRRVRREVPESDGGSVVVPERTPPGVGASPRPSRPGVPTSRPHGGPRGPIAPPRSQAGERAGFHEALATVEVLEPVMLPPRADDDRAGLDGADERLSARQDPWTPDRRGRSDSEPIVGGLFRRLAVVPSAERPPHERPDPMGESSTVHEAPEPAATGLQAPGPSTVGREDVADPDGGHVAPGADVDGDRALDVDGAEAEPEASPPSPREPDPGVEAGPIVARSPGEVPRPTHDDPPPWRPGHPTNPGIRRPRPSIGGSTWDSVTQGSPIP